MTLRMCSVLEPFYGNSVVNLADAADAGSNAFFRSVRLAARACPCPLQVLRYSYASSSGTDRKRYRSMAATINST